MDPVLFQAGDLPNQYSSGQISYRWAGNLPQPYPPDNVIIQKVVWRISEGFDDDYLLIALFAEENNLLATYEDIISSIEDKPFEDSSVGEKSRFVFLPTFSGRVFFIFVQCYALVAIDITGADVNKELMESFATRIDKRLRPVVCP